MGTSYTLQIRPKRLGASFNYNLVENTDVPRNRQDDLKESLLDWADI